VCVRYEESLQRSWRPGDECQVTYLEDPKPDAVETLDFEPQLSMWLAHIIDVSVSCEEYPTSNWGAVKVQFQAAGDSNGAEDRFSPWEIVPDHLPERVVASDPNAFPEVFRLHALEVLQRIRAERLDDEFWEPHPTVGRAVPVSLEAVLIFFEPVDVRSSMLSCVL
jgi:hypothetical protein